jgi:cytokinesis protein
MPRSIPSTMRHLLLIQEDPDMVGYYRFMDSLVRDVVMDRKLGTAERRLEHAVQRLIAQLNDAQRYQTAIEEAAEARSQALSLKLEKEALEEDVARSRWSRGQSKGAGSHQSTSRAARDAGNRV